MGLDLLGTQLDLRVGNFRKINIKTIPVYGMAQPTNDVSEMSLVLRKPVFGVSDLVPHKPGCTAIKDD